MNTELQFAATVDNDLAEPHTVAETVMLERAIAKIVQFGAQVGVSPDQMIELVRSGLTVRELLQYLVARTGEVA